MLKTIFGVVGIYLILWVAFFAGAVYVAFHFLSKFW
jgi:hypothetical protein